MLTLDDVDAGIAKSTDSKRRSAEPISCSPICLSQPRTRRGPSLGGAQTLKRGLILSRVEWRRTKKKSLVLRHYSLSIRFQHNTDRERHIQRQTTPTGMYILCKHYMYPLYHATTTTSRTRGAERQSQHKVISHYFDP